MVRRPRLLDLYCGAGGAAMGYHRAGWDVVGVDIVRQWEYPFRFELGDALAYPLEGYDAIHASPPCKAHTAARHLQGGRARLFDPHTNHLTPMLERLAGLTVPWVVENVPGAPMPPSSVVYCGSSFGLEVRRHRLFASNVELTAPPCDHANQPKVISVVGHTPPGRGRGVALATMADRCKAMGVDWVTDRDRLSQMIPPAYTAHIGAQLLAALELERTPIF